ncbi:hypothetical protein [Burkholderia pseudomultivorans]|uniref:hypothetical protein n=1 Tax=Burkholderia pseudomultivorans TaxID=1207504 RepID=UPI0008415B8D|nr:hypothetical protein [Burkholderia pseudomultivorans]AOI89857.1 hypothetical protein WS57_13035 [Burkholderia pseudomultivorans]
MSTLKRLFDVFVDARRLRRASHDLSKHRQQAIERIFETDLAYVRAVFAETPEALRSESFPDYPGAAWIGELGVSAFYVTQDVEVEQFPIYVNLVIKGRERVGPRQFVRDGLLHTFFSAVDRHSGKQVSLLTNDVELVRSVSAFVFNPPPPWIAWYELGPLTFNLQGDAQYWYVNVWDRYWESLSSIEQDAFIDRCRTSTAAYLNGEEREEWFDSIRMRDSRYRDRLRIAGSGNRK